LMQALHHGQPDPYPDMSNTCLDQLKICGED
jgi:hypothetical protein